MTKTVFAALALCCALPLAAQDSALAPHQQLARDVYRQLIEINTADSVGSVTRAAAGGRDHGAGRGGDARAVRAAGAARAVHVGRGDGWAVPARGRGSDIRGERAVRGSERRAGPWAGRADAGEVVLRRAGVSVPADDAAGGPTRLNYIGAGLIVTSFLFAIGYDATDIARNRYRNGQPLPVALAFPEGYDSAARRVPVEIRIDARQYASFYRTEAAAPAPAASYPGYLLFG
jgi:hypothetical protein